MNQMLQDTQVQETQILEAQVQEAQIQEAQIQASPEVIETPDVPERPPTPAHQRFSKPQRVAFVQSAWHREVVEECRIAFLAEIEARQITNFADFKGPGSLELPRRAQIM